MATKKQKHEAAMLKREQFLAEERERGLTIQRKAREQKERKQKQKDEARDTTFPSALKPRGEKVLEEHDAWVISALNGKERADNGQV